MASLVGLARRLLGRRELENSDTDALEAEKKKAALEEVLESHLYWQDQDRVFKTTCWLMPEDERNMVPRAVVAENPLRVKLVVPPKSPIGLDIRIFTYGRDQNSPLSITLETSEGTVLIQRILETSGFQDGDPVRVLDLDSLELSPGTPLLLKFSSEADTTNCIALAVVSVPIGRYSTRSTIVDYRQERSFLAGSVRDFRNRVAVVVNAPNGHANHPFDRVTTMFNGMSIVLVEAVHIDDEWQTLIESDLVAFVADGFSDCKVPRFEAICFALHRRGVTTMFVDPGYEKRYQLEMGGSIRRSIDALERQAQHCHFQCRPLAERTEIVDSISRDVWSRPYTLSSSNIQDLISLSRKRRRSVDLILVGPQTAEFTLDPLSIGLLPSQKLTIFPVNCEISPIGAGWPKTVDIQPTATTILEAARAGSGDVVLIAEQDANGLGQEIAEHLFEHFFDDVDVVVSRRSYSAADPLVQGGLNRVSVKRSSTLSALEDALRLLSTDQDEWSSTRAGIELGLHVYKNGGVIRQTHNIRPDSRELPSNLAEILSDTVKQSNAEIALALRRNANIHSETVAAPNLARKMPIRILTYRWHAPHQYELHRLPAEFTMVSGASGMEGFEQWPYGERPKRPNVRIRRWSEIRPADYDVALLHFDENLLIPFLSNGNLPPGWGESARRLSQTGLPIVGLCHGTVPFVGQYGVAGGPIHEFQHIELARQQLVSWFDNLGAQVVCNSFQAQSEWAFKQSRVFWHGFDPLEYPSALHTRDVLVVGGKDRPHYRGLYEEDAVRTHLHDGIRVERLPPRVVPLEREGGNPFAVRRFRAYVDAVRNFSFYLNTTLRSPMPRSRGEAMMTGVIPVSLRNHDVEIFIEQGVDGFYADDPETLAAFINDVHADRERLKRMSHAARMKAFDIFNHDRNLKAWIRLLDEVLS